MKHVDSNILLLLNSLCFNLSTIYLYAYYGVAVTVAFYKYADYLFESLWYELPVEFQRYVQLMICNSQQMLRYKGSDLFTLNLSSFTKVG